MKALKLYGPQDLRLEESPIPEITDDDILVKNYFCAVCGSDFRNTMHGGSGHGMSLPKITGHEAVGEIVQIGKNWSNVYKIGSGIAYLPGISCGRCIHCLKGHRNECIHKKTLAYQADGSFAEYTLIPGELVRSGGVIPFPLYEGCEELALCEPLSCAINAQEISNVSLCDSIMIAGCGPLGLLHIQLAKLHGAVPIIAVDIDDQRLNIAKELGADFVLNPTQCNLTQEVDCITEGIGLDVVIAALPNPDFVAESLSFLAKEGRLNVFGGLPKNRSTVEIDLNRIHYNELRIDGTSDSTPEHFRYAYQLIRSKRIRTEPIISKIIDLEETASILNQGIQKGFIKLVVNPRVQSGKEESRILRK